MNKIEDVYGLTPAQEGMYIQTLDNKHTEAYQLYYLFELAEETDVELLQQAIRFLAVRHPVLKSAFAVVEGATKQVIISDREPYIESINTASVYSEEALQKIISEKSAYSFDLQRDSLMRCCFIRFSDKRFLFFHTHHLIADGWSMSVLIKDTMAYYRFLSENNDAELLEKRIAEEKNESASFASYVNLIRAYDSDAMKRYWSELLLGSYSCNLPKTADLKNESNIIKREITVSSSLCQSIENFSRSVQMPVNTVLESVFALTLNKHMGAKDIVFNKVISGRSIGLANLEQTVGPMINTVPVRVVYNKNITVQNFLQQINRQSISANENGFLALSEIYRSNGIDPNSVDVLYVFENYGDQDENTKMQLMQLIYHKEETEFPFEVIISPKTEGYSLQCIFDCNQISEELVSKIQSSFISIAQRLTETDEALMLNAVLELTDEKKENTKKESVKTESNAQQYQPPESETEKEICRIFCKTLKVESIGRNDNFYDFGGTSLQIVMLLSHPPLDKLSPSDFMAEPTPAALAKILDGAKKTEYTYIVELYKSENVKKAVVLFPFAGGDAAAYTALVAKAREDNSEIALYFVDWFDENKIDEIADEIRLLSNSMTVCFYSHCAGSALAMALMDRLNTNEAVVKNYIAGASIPPSKMLSNINIWKHMSDKRIMRALGKAGLPAEANNTFRLEDFRLHTEFCSLYFRRKTNITNVMLTAVVSRNDPLTKNFADAKELWQRNVTKVREVVLIDTPSHYFQNTDAQLLLSLFSDIS